MCKLILFRYSEIQNLQPLKYSPDTRTQPILHNLISFESFFYSFIPFIQNSNKLPNLLIIPMLNFDSVCHAANVIAFFLLVLLLCLVVLLLPLLLLLLNS